MTAKNNINGLVHAQHKFGKKQTRLLGLTTILILSLVAISAQAAPARDPVSDRVGATAGQFRVDESGSATYSIPIYTPPGTAGVVPQLAFSYNSQGGNGPLGKGWGVSGTSGISRCRATREHGDFFANGAAIDGDPAPINFSSSDRFCLDGQRLIPAPATALVCKALAGATVTQYRTELESFQRICEYRFILADGPRFFTVERKDGSTSWYGDRVSTTGSASGTRSDSVIPVTATPSVFLGWAQTRFQDSTGNYIDYDYLNNPAGATYTGEQLLYQVRYTGKVVLPGQTGLAKPTYATVRFNYSALPAADIVSGYSSGMLMYQTQKLDSVSVLNGSTTVRHYVLTYAKSISGTNANTLTSFKECSDSTQITCYSPTNFDWSVARNQLANYEYPTDLNIGGNDSFEGYQLGDIDGDGRQDMVWLEDGSSGSACPTEYIRVGFGSIDTSGRNTFNRINQTAICTDTELMSARGDGSWMLFDYNGDGRDDLFMTRGDNSSWVIYPSLGKPASGGKVFDNAQNLISGLTPAIPSSGKDNHPQLADFNGDGLLDVVYSVTGGRRARLMVRNGSVFNWGNELTVNFTTSLDSDCSVDVDCIKGSATLYRKNSSFQLLDFNGDSRSDLLTNYTKTYHYYDPSCQVQSVGIKPSAHRSTKALAVPNCVTNQTWKLLVSMNVTSITSTSINFDGGSSWETQYSENGVIITTYQTGQRFADFNGDGLTDLLVENGVNWILHINTGKTFINTGITFNPSFSDYLQIVDVNGDGRADVIYPQANKYTFDVRYGLATGGFSAPSAFPGGAALINCSDTCMSRYSYIFSDFDADGALDSIRIKWATASGGGPDQRIASIRGDSISRFQPRDVIMRITNGFGAKTELAYQPLSVKSIYLRDSNSRNSLNWGRGSPVQDLLAPMYVVAMARSSAPTYSNTAAMSTLYYRYAGAKMQAGGRGYLGFREITTFDVNYGGKYIVSTTQYAQNFPFIGSPVSTSRRVITGTYAPDACYTVISESCFSTPGTAFPAFGGTQIAYSVQAWEVSPAFTPATQEPLQTRTQGTQDEQFDLGTGVRTSRVNTALSYTTFGNVSLTMVDTYTGINNTSPVSISTNNTYVNDEANWRLGRMTTSSVTHTRNGSSITRNTGYAYDMAGPVTGFLTSERIQPNGNWREDLRTEYQLDDYGNRIASYTCSQNIVNCKITTLNNPIWNSYNTVQRYSRVTFDADGRYPLTTHEPFRAVGSAWDSGQTGEYITQTVITRDEFGEPTQVQDVNGRSAASMNGAMGRDYWIWAPTASTQTLGATGVGIHSFKTYRFCGVGTDQVSCPTGAVFREQVSATGSGSKWTYFDVLGRPILAAAQSFNENQTGKDFAATCQWYDSTGKNYGASNPFFLSDAALNGAPQFTTNPCVLANRDVAYSVYDVLGRPTQVILPDGSSTAMAYNGLSTTTTNAKLQTKTEVKNASGELVTATDHLGFSTNYAYNAAGNLITVTRNAGRGNIVTSMGYDTLGRKISMIDPDAGSWTYDYTPAGELERTLDVAGNGQFKRYDFRGRIVWEGKQTAANISSSNFESSAISIFDSAANAVGQLQSSAITGLYTGWAATPDRNVNQSQAIAYDDMGRVQNTATQIDGVNYNSFVVYDSLGRGYKAQDPSGKWTKTEYTPRGYAVRVCSTDANDTAPGCLSGNANTYLETLSTDARGNVLSDKRGGSASMITERSYDPFTGRLTKICAGGGGTNCQILSEQYGWDTIGNLTYQEKALYREEFSYDGLNRVTEGRFARVGTTAYVGAARPFSLSNTYDLLGNICNKLIDGVNQNYSYAGRAGCGLNGSNGNVNTDLVSSPHQVRSANGYTYAYDAHGNQTIASHGTASKTRAVSYTLDDRAYEMTKGSDVTRFWYGMGGDRYKRVDISVAGTKTTINVGNLEIETLNGVTTTKRTVAGVLLEETKNAVVTNKYLHHDQLGSVARITDTNGNTLESMDFAAFGERRNVIDPRLNFNNGGQVSNGTVTLPGNQILTLYATKRGFTGHEMVDGFDIVHMNGRIYDNMIGRFLQADPVVQDPSNTQNFNRYTYVWNNPLAYTDPSGYFAWRSFISTVAQIVGFICYFIPGLQWVGYALNVASALLNGGLKAGLLSAFTPFIPLPGQAFARLLTNMVIAGVSSVIMGGKFGAGAIGALKSAAIGFVMQNVAAGVKSSISKKEEITVVDTDSYGASTSGRREDRNSYDYLTKSANHIVGDTMKSEDGETLKEFQWRVRDRLDSLTTSTGFEHAAALSVKLVPGVDWPVYAAVIQTSNSPVVSVANRFVVGDGWNINQDLSMHTHGFFKPGYRLSKLDATYLNENGNSRASYRGRGTDSWVDRNNFSTQDMKSQSVWLSTETGLTHGYRPTSNSGWINAPASRPQSVRY
jgi:RHS repeat-associated protein